MCKCHIKVVKNKLTKLPFHVCLFFLILTKDIHYSAGEVPYLLGNIIFQNVVIPINIDVVLQFLFPKK